MDNFYPDGIQHARGPRKTGDAATRVLSPTDFGDAWSEITGWDGYGATPLLMLPELARAAGLGEIHYKHEGPRFGLASFKALGAAYAAERLLAREVGENRGEQVTLADIASGKFAADCARITLVSATDGNHGRSLAWGCQRFGAPCRIYIHAEVSQGREDAVRAYGAEVIRCAGDYDFSVAQARDEAAENGWFVVSDTSWPGYTEPPRDVMAGYGVMAREAFEALSQPPTHILIQGGVGGLAAAVAAQSRQFWGAEVPRLIVVEPDRAACLIESARQGSYATVTIHEETIMAGLSCGEPSPLAWDVLAEEATDFLAIPDRLVGPTVRLLARPLGDDPAIEAGESAVAGLAAALAARRDRGLSETLGLDGSSRILVFGSEGITDPEIYHAIMEGNDV